MHLFLIGAGHVGLVTAVGLARLGHRVTVADIDATRIEGLQRGVAPIYEPGLEGAIGELLATASLAFTTALTPPDDARFSIVTVSTPTGPDGPLSTTNVEAVVEGLLATTGADHTVIVRSTLPVDGPARLVALRGGRTDAAAIVTNPEFMREGTALRDFDKPDRLVVGWLEERDRAAADAVLALYDGIDAKTLVADAPSVALVKLATNVFLATKVAYANELARICDVVGADVDTVADGIGLDPRIGRAFLTAGPGYGGSCLPEQAIALSLTTAGRGIPTPLIAAVSRSNETHQQAIVSRLSALLGGDDGSLAGCRVALLGLAFKANTDDVRESPALSLAQYLRAQGAVVVGTDPRALAKAGRADPGLVTADTVEAAVDGADAVLVATEWQEYAGLDWADLARRMRGDLVYDTRDIVPRDAVTSAGLRYASLGRG
jgi:UDPglucose 6-dehydrogenase